MPCKSGAIVVRHAPRLAIRRLIGEPFRGRDDVVVDDTIFAFAECEPGEICKSTVRNHDGAPKSCRAELLVQLLLRQWHVHRRRLHLEGVIEDLALLGVPHQEENLALPRQLGGRLAANARQDEIADKFDPQLGLQIALLGGAPDTPRSDFLLCHNAIARLQFPPRP